MSAPTLWRVTGVRPGQLVKLVKFCPYTDTAVDAVPFLERVMDGTYVPLPEDQPHVVQARETGLVIALDDTLALVAFSGTSRLKVGWLECAWLDDAV